MSVAEQGRISVVIPVFNEEANLPVLVPRLLAVLRGLARPFEAIFVDDGSRDRSLELLRAYVEDFPRELRVVELSRNFGQHPAILAGFAITTGDVVVTLDADLQNPPEEIPKLIALVDQGFDVVGGVRQTRRDSLFRRAASWLVNRVTVAITGIRMTDYGCMLRAYSREIVDLINRCEEYSTFIPALAQTFSRRPAEVRVAHAERAAGASKYSLYRLIRLNFDLMTGFSVAPLQFFTMAGMALALVSFFFVVVLAVRRLVVGSEVQGVFTLFGIAFFLIGVLLIGLGVVGVYVGRMFEQVRQRPRYTVSAFLE
ncbi:MAG: glycosyltransferase, partial [Gemmatimonadaceae bacterium]